MALGLALASGLAVAAACSDSGASVGATPAICRRSQCALSAAKMLSCAGKKTSGPAR
jgi:hypothetical protein